MGSKFEDWSCSDFCYFFDFFEIRSGLVISESRCRQDSKCCWISKFTYNQNHLSAMLSFPVRLSAFILSQQRFRSSFSYRPSTAWRGTRGRRESKFLAKEALFRLGLPNLIPVDHKILTQKGVFSDHRFHSKKSTRPISTPMETAAASRPHNPATNSPHLY
jgi:hypothetical protein